jgi:hypothetical protein
VPSDFDTHANLGHVQPSGWRRADHAEAKRLGLNVTYLTAEDDLWRRMWLLRCMYEYDARAKGVVKIFEGLKYSSSIRQGP